MDNVTQSELLAKPDAANALRGVITAACHVMGVVTGSFAEREQALLAALQEAGRVALEQDLQRIEDGLPAQVAVGTEKRVHKEHQQEQDTYLCLFGDPPTTPSVSAQSGAEDTDTLDIFSHAE